MLKFKDEKSDTPGIDAMIFGDHVLIDQNVELNREVLDLLKTWKKSGRRMALVSSRVESREVFEQQSLKDFFDLLIFQKDCCDLHEGISSFSELLLRAVSGLGVLPENCLFFDSTPRGVQAGQNAFFGLVVGIAPLSRQEYLKKSGADRCVEDFLEFQSKEKQWTKNLLFRQGIPIFPDRGEFFELFEEKLPVIFLDYDGTLTPIVARPQDALLDDDMRETLKTLAGLFTVAVVTGRDMEDVKSLVGLDELVYAGSHGYIISGPGKLQMEHPDSEKILPVLDAMEEELEILLKARTQGTQLDRKRFAIGIHYRNARKQDQEVVYSIAREILDRYQGFKLGEGKKILEVKPDLDWHKGKAVEWILDALALSERGEILPVFIGDDLTDEDAFTSLHGKGIGILVGGHGKETRAKYALKNVFQVKAFFRKLIDIYRQHS